ncbi:Hypothetical_protein [Hexamita inflata]|uniref:Hypothetical_protein n=1 Tax=Hexamita inflata TaxID=28002 RepID=A0AA86QT40_9EUKA|nr:Hypothetical protein HINF_LOCUS46673 [Hexamita inflata]
MIYRNTQPSGKSTFEKLRAVHSSAPIVPAHVQCSTKAPPISSANRSSVHSECELELSNNTVDWDLIKKFSVFSLSNGLETLSKRLKNITDICCAHSHQIQRLETFIQNYKEAEERRKLFAQVLKQDDQFKMWKNTK